MKVKIVAGIVVLACLGFALAASAQDAPMQYSYDDLGRLGSGPKDGSPLSRVILQVSIPEFDGFNFGGRA